MVEGREILAEDVTEADFTSYVRAANHAISNLDLEIRSALHQTSRQRVYALVNTTSDPATQLATTFTPDELGFVKRVLDSMFESNNSRRHEVMAVPTLYALKLHNKTAGGRRVSAQGAAAANGDGEATQGGGAQPITIMQAEKVLQGLLDQGWLEKSRKGFVSLSPRALMELRGWLIETYNEPDDSDEEGARTRPQRIKFCYACKEIVTVVRIEARRDDVCSQWLTEGILRASDATRGTVDAGCTMAARPSSSVPKNRKSARCARPTGRATSSLARGHGRRTRLHSRRGGGVEHLLRNVAAKPLRRPQRIVPRRFKRMSPRKKMMTMTRMQANRP